MDRIEKLLDKLLENQRDVSYWTNAIARAVGNDAPLEKPHENLRAYAAARDALRRQIAERDRVLVKALENIRDTAESCYVAGGWVPLDEEEAEAIADISNAALARAKGESNGTS